jgi:tRNA A37 threonylcarbamoyladenosine dehydratase
MSRLTVALIGCGGLGAILAECLARTGFGGIVLIDDDVLEETNLNRYQGATPISANQNFDNIFNIVTLKAPC